MPVNPFKWKHGSVAKNLAPLQNPTFRICTHIVTILNNATFYV